MHAGAATFRDDGAKFFLEIAEHCDLQAEWVLSETGEGWCRIPTQDGLAWDCTMELVNEDELWFGVGGFFTLSLFPATDQERDFRAIVAGFLCGQSRIRVRWGRAFLESPDGGRWKIEARYTGVRWHGWRERILFKDGERAA